MRIPFLLPAMAFVALSAALAPAADLAAIDRRFVKEPTYQSKPRYCLLVFGPEAQTRVWLVQDGDTLYVDRNGNGDLTEAGKKVSAKKGDYTDTAEGVFFFEAGDVQGGKQTHKNLKLSVTKLDQLANIEPQVKDFLARHPQARGYRLGIEVAMPGWQGVGNGSRVEHVVAANDINGVLQFAERPEDAPVIHFGGPWQVTFFGPHRLTIGREEDLFLSVATPGLGPGTLAYVGYEGVIPETVYPTVEITYPPRQGQAPVKEHYELKRRC
jgi:hypothetical protein